MLEIIHLNLYETAGLAVVVLFLGMILKQKVSFLDKYCIPSPVVGGLLVAFINYVIYQFGFVFTTDRTLEKLCLVLFFTSVGVQIDFNLIKRSFSTFALLLVGIIVLIFAQNILSLSLSSIFDLDKLMAFTASSISMAGGTGISEQFGGFLEDMNLADGTNLSLSMCTLGVLVSALVGGPFGRFLILKYKLKPNSDKLFAENIEDSNVTNSTFPANLAKASFQIAFIIGIGAVCCEFLFQAGISVPYYIGAMLVAIILRNLSIKTGRYHFYTGELNYIGVLSLSFYLAMNFMGLAVWQFGLINILQLGIFVAQFILMLLFAFFMVYILTGRDYDAAVLSASSIGFGIGGPSSSVATLMVLTGKYGPSFKSYLLFPIVGFMLADPINCIILSYFMRMF